MKKRWLAASLAALMALSMTACGGGKAAETTAAPAETKVEETKAENPRLRTLPKRRKQRRLRKITPAAWLFIPRMTQIR